MQRLSYPTETVLSNKITGNRKILSNKDSPIKPLRQRPLTWNWTYSPFNLLKEKRYPPEAGKLGKLSRNERRKENNLTWTYSPFILLKEKRNAPLEGKFGQNCSRVRQIIINISQQIFSSVPNVSVGLIFLQKVS